MAGKNRFDATIRKSTLSCNYETPNSTCRRRKARLAAAQSLLASAEGALAQANEEFRAAVGRAPGRLDVVSPAALQHNLEDARAFAMRRHPDVIGAQHGVSAAELNIRRAEAALKLGDIAGALSELEDLSDAAKSEMAEWIKAARARQAAVRAANVLASSVNE